MKIKDIMTKKVISVAKDDSIAYCAKLMEKNNIGIVVVVSAEKKVLGVVTDRDITIRATSKDLNPLLSVEKIMTSPVKTINLFKDITEAITTMADYQLHRIVVTNNFNQLEGIISISDIALNKPTREYINELIYEISIPNITKDKPLKYLKVEDFPL